MRELELQGRLEEIGICSFEGCISLRALKINGDCKTIKNEAFKRCSQLEELQINGKLETIGNYAFFECTRLERISLPEGLTGLHCDAFSRCGLKEIIIPKSIDKLEIGTFNANKNLERVIIEGDIYCIGGSCFIGCEKLREVKFLGKCKEIWSLAFKDCKSLKRIILPDGIEFIKEEAFEGAGLEYIELEGTCGKIERNIVRKCKGFKGIKIAKGMELKKKEVGRETIFYVEKAEDI